LVRPLISKIYAKAESYSSMFTTGVVPTASIFLKKHRMIKKIAIPPKILAEFNHEYAQLEQCKKHVTAYPPKYAISKKNALFLYSYVRKNKPKIVVETGVANGFSSRFILAALKRNGLGKLYSVDIKKDVGELVPDAFKDRWNLVIGPPRITLCNLLEKLEYVDVFVHDSDHKEENMLYEFKLAYPKVSMALVSDDVQMNNAFFMFAKSTGADADVYLCLRKAFGVIEVHR
jgi:hypothetical protein